MSNKFKIEFWEVGDSENKPKWVVDEIYAGKFAKIKCEGGFDARCTIPSYISHSKFGYQIHDSEKLKKFLEQHSENLEIIINENT